MKRRKRIHVDYFPYFWDYITLLKITYLYSEFLKPRDSTRLTQEIGINVG
ncbi:hypothetical protein C5S31_09435 [ANME-1 cluster archaeon GoMg2]|nr:hypothetical protein [ANME-1 cluster archaeon GoMg2]